MAKPSPHKAPGALEARLHEALAGVSRNRTWLAGVSGGADSTALLHALAEAGFKRIVVCHLNHTLRGRASANDGVFVARTAKKLGFALESASAGTAEFSQAAGISLELAARELRQAFFRESARRRRCPRLFLAHQADDQVETCLFQFLRGSGAAGLAGMRAVSHCGGLEIHRPLLGVSRREILDYLESRKIAFREDASNSDPAHTRNRIRHEVIPAIRKAFGESFRSAVLRAAEILRTDDDWLESLVPEAGETLSCRELRALPPPVLSRAVLRWLRGNGVPEPGFQETRRVLSLLDVEGGPAKVSLPGNLHARRKEGRIFLGREGA